MKSLPWILGAAGLTLGACTNPPDEKQTETTEPLPITAAQASLTANATIKNHLTELAVVIKAFEDSKLLGEIFPKSSPTEPTCPEGAQCETEEGASELDISDEAADVEKWLSEHVFTDANVESTTPTSVTYRLTKESMCPEETVDGVLTRDADCVKVFGGELAWRYTATSRADGDLDLSVNVGTSHPADVELKAARVTITTDLAEVKKAADLVAGTLGEDIEGFPTTFEGKVKLAVTRDAEKVYSLAVSVVNNVRVGDHVETHPEYYFVDVATGSDVLKATLNGVAKTAVGAMDWKAVDAKGALNLFFPAASETSCETSEDPNVPPNCTTTEHPPRTGVLAAHLAGLSFLTDFTATNDHLAVSNVGLGAEATTVKYNGTQVFSFDLNKDSGRKLAFEANHNDRVTTVSVNPGLVARATYDFTSLEAQLEEIETWLKTGFTEVKLEGSAPAIEFEESESVESQPCPAPTDTGTSCSTDGDCAIGDFCGYGMNGQNGMTCQHQGECPQPPPGDEGHFKVTAGSLTLSANGVTSVTVAAGQCVTESESSSEGPAHPFQSVASGTCN